MTTVSATFAAVTPHGGLDKIFADRYSVQGSVNMGKSRPSHMGVFVNAVVSSLLDRCAFSDVIVGGVMMGRAMTTYKSGNDLVVSNPIRVSLGK